MDHTRGLSKPLHAGQPNLIKLSQVLQLVEDVSDPAKSGFNRMWTGWDERAEAATVFLGQQEK